MMWKAHKKLTWRERLVNLCRNKLGFSTCYWCGGAWNWKKGHDIIAKDGRGGIFPCCEDCWKIMTLEQKIDAVKDFYCRTGHPRYSLEEFIDVVKKEGKDD